jgi:16S rRNA (guanine1516-N2)-methyltransferase
MGVVEFKVQQDQFSALAQQWKVFLATFSDFELDYQIIFDSQIPTILDSENRKLRIDFENDVENYKKYKSSIASEPLSRALGAGKKGQRVLDLSAGMAVDAVFLAQLGYQVTAIERNPLLYLANSNAMKNCSQPWIHNLQFFHSEALHFLKTTSLDFDVCYFDPMFPQKKKSALPKQEMVLFKNLVGSDLDAAEVLQFAIDAKKFNRCVVKRPLSAEPLIPASGAIEGKIIRYDIYGGSNDH